MSESLQVRNAALVNWLSGDLQPRYDPAFSWKTAVSMMLDLPAVRAVWTMGNIDYQNPQVIDETGKGYDLSVAGAVGNVEFGYDPAPALAPVAIFGGGANQYLSRADAGAGTWADILGTENYVPAAQRGLTLGGWFWWAALPGAIITLMAKNDAGANLQYILQTTVANNIQFFVRPGPVGVISAGILNTGWNHCTGIYDQSTQTVFVELNGVITSGVVGAAPAALADTAAAFTIGANGAGGVRFTGYTSLCWLEACSLSQTHAQSLFWQQAAMFGVQP